MLRNAECMFLGSFAHSEYCVEGVVKKIDSKGLKVKPQKTGHQKNNFSHIQTKSNSFHKIVSQVLIINHFY